MGRQCLQVRATVVKFKKKQKKTDIRKPNPNVQSLKPSVKPGIVLSASKRRTRVAKFKGYVISTKQPLWASPNSCDQMNKGRPSVQTVTYKIPSLPISDQIIT